MTETFDPSIDRTHAQCAAAWTLTMSQLRHEAQDWSKYPRWRMRRPSKAGGTLAALGAAKAGLQAARVVCCVVSHSPHTTIDAT